MQTIEWEKIKPPPPEMLTPHEELPACPKDQESTLLNKLVVVKVN